MSTLKTLQQLPQLFRYADVQKFTANANVFLTRALKQGLIERLARGVYINAAMKGMPQIEETACFIRTPCYISCEWALNYHGITIQAPAVCTVITLSTAVGESRRMEYQGVTIEFSRIAYRLFTGFEMREGFSIATPEKALLDTLYFRKGLPVKDELELNGVDTGMLYKLAEFYPKRVKEWAMNQNRNDSTC
jgi:predicted transcriptional regulator of viral defense system